MAFGIADLTRQGGQKRGEGNSGLMLATAVFKGVVAEGLPNDKGVFRAIEQGGEGQPGSR